MRSATDPYPVIPYFRLPIAGLYNKTWDSLCPNGWRFDQVWLLHRIRHQGSSVQCARAYPGVRTAVAVRARRRAFRTAWGIYRLINRTPKWRWLKRYLLDRLYTRWIREGVRRWVAFRAAQGEDEIDLAQLGPCAKERWVRNEAAMAALGRTLPPSCAGTP